MSAAKETLGYPSRTAAVLALRAQGLRPADVARKLGIPAKSVAALECSARRRSTQHKPADQGTHRLATIMLTDQLRGELRPHARRRDVSVERLALCILETVAQGDLVDAVLDDAEELEP